MTTIEINWIAGRRILHIHQRGKLTPLEITLTYDEIIDTVKTWPPNQPYLIMWDASTVPLVEWTPQITTRSEDLRDVLLPYRAGRLAGVLKPSPLAKVVKIFVEAIFLRRTFKAQVCVFFSKEEAMAWLEELL